MSIFLSVTGKCPKCATEEKIELAASVNADRRPDLRQAILDGSFQGHECPKCGTRMRLPAHLSFLDVKRGQWILVENDERLADWTVVEDEARETFGDAFGPHTPEFVQEIGRELTPRLVFGWPALREKLVCRELSLDDTTLELLKIAVLRNVPNPPLADQTELRLVSGSDETLTFAWIITATEARVSELEVPRGAYDGIASPPGPWAPLRATFDGAMFVDVKRLIGP